MSSQLKENFSILNLTATQSAFYTLDRGTIIIVETGSIHIKTQLNLAGLTVPQIMRLNNGQSHIIQTTQLCQIMANGKTKIRLMHPASQFNKRHMGWPRMVLAIKAGWIGIFEGFKA